jgi:L-rhamnose isomerase
MGLDFNPTFFAHPKASGLTLTSPDEEIRAFWVRHGKACVKISEYFARETGVPCVMNIWIPDGFKEIPADRMGPRRRYMQSLDEILSVKESKDVYVTLESKVFGIGLESCTAGSGEFCLGYSISRGIVPLMDNGHYHPTEDVSDKISALLLFSDKIAFHLTRSVRWDSDHVVRFNDEMRSIANEVVASGRVDDIFLALDFFDASINRVAAWVNGIRNAQKSLLFAFLTPHARLTEYQDAGNFTRVLSESEELKTMPFGAVWNEFCRMAGVPADGEWLSVVEEYEKEVLLNR